MVSAKKTLLVVDFSGHGLRTCLFDMKHRLLADVAQEVTIHSPKTGWLEYDPGEIVYALRSTINQCLNEAGVSPQSVQEIGITGENPAYLVFDTKTGMVLSSAILTACPRLESQYRRLKSGTLSQMILDNHEQVLHRESPILIWEWVKQSLGDVPKGQWVFGDVGAWLMFNLTGMKSTAVNVCNALEYQLYDVQKRQWNDYVAGMVDLSEKHLPQLQKKGKPFGVTKGFIPLVDGVPVTHVHSEVVSSLVSVGATNFGDAYLDLHDRYATLFVNIGAEKGIDLDHRLDVVLDGELVTFFSKRVPFPALPEFVGVISDYIGVQLSFWHSEDDELCMVPYYTDSGVKCLVKGVTEGTTSEDWIRALIEAMVFSIKGELDRLENQIGLRIRRLFVDGELVAFDALIQFLANVLQVDLMQCHEMEEKFFGVMPASESKKKTVYEKSWSPEMDPITSFSLFNQWSQQADKVV